MFQSTVTIVLSRILQYQCQETKQNKTPRPFLPAGATEADVTHSSCEVSEANPSLSHSHLAGGLKYNNSLPRLPWGSKNMVPSRKGEWAGWCVCLHVCAHVCVCPDVNTAQPLCAQSVSSSAHLLPVPPTPPGMLMCVFSLASSIKDENIWGAVKREMAERQHGLFFFYLLWF